MYALNVVMTSKDNQNALDLVFADRKFSKVGTMYFSNADDRHKLVDCFFMLEYMADNFERRDFVSINLVRVADFDDCRPVFDKAAKLKKLREVLDEGERSPVAEDFSLEGVLAQVKARRGS